MPACVRVLGIDPGFGTVGYGVLEMRTSKIELVSYGAIRTEPDEPIPDRLLKIHDQLERLIQECSPDESAVEELFFFRNVTTAIQVSEARGVILLAMRRHEVPIFEYTPHQVKLAITGYGRAEKGQVQRTLKAFLRMKETPRPDDAADALAVAWCHLAARKFPGGVRKA
ncbi:MAG TPA: crossover junction endodeoxyribonuclease RuvC [Mesotoga infera]|uniref:Crossover junction endodeoxyribonuclease RuvC n=1 Tax=Mesotoga infera TaxID=1236046 RepID=A0A101I936_9BACT|nr:crossover junction endodeoxyribonuclease RuvC [Mesotoga sp. UBA6090]KUK68477.1 MAG: Crossover junction endodeoxyribonuclease RuvC [Mesotoga infera]KUK91037.1 MAG: Crossover junction endodeoxyribonuclease RuvC [Mesotoga infera]HCO69207.1 crossover junction endodeoxyribonuclease RuvC [Mesotoga infera]